VEIGPLTLDMDLLCWEDVGAAVAAAEALKRRGVVERYRGRRTCWVEEREREKVRRARGVSVFISLEEDERSAQEEKKM
jgi:hypothetical protein